MIAYHFTSARHLRPIARHGLTVGDVPTDIEKVAGRVGVWLTTAATAEGHGLDGSGADKTAYRLSVEVPDASPLLVRWTTWAPKHVTPRTIKALHEAASMSGEGGPDTWLIFFGVIRPAAILACTAMRDGSTVQNWSELSPPELDEKGVPAARRDAWQRQMLKQVTKALQAQRADRRRLP